MEPTQIRLGRGMVGAGKAELIKPNPPARWIPNPAFRTSVCLFATSHPQLFSTLEGSGRMLIVGSDRVSLGLPTHQDINPCDPPEDAPRLPAA